MDGRVQDLELSQHARDMLQEREIQEEWMWRTVLGPDRIEVGMDGNTHYMKVIPEHAGRFLRVVVNVDVQPGRIVTLFFDRWLRRRM